MKPYSGPHSWLQTRQHSYNSELDTKIRQRQSDHNHNHNHNDHVYHGRFVTCRRQKMVHDLLLLDNAPIIITRGQSNLTKSASRGANSPVRGHPRGSKVVPLNSWGRVSFHSNVAILYATIY